MTTENTNSNRTVFLKERPKPGQYAITRGGDILLIEEEQEKTRKSPTFAARNELGQTLYYWAQPRRLGLSLIDTPHLDIVLAVNARSRADAYLSRLLTPDMERDIRDTLKEFGKDPAKGEFVPARLSGDYYDLIAKSRRHNKAYRENLKSRAKKRQARKIAARSEKNANIRANGLITDAPPAEYARGASEKFHGPVHTIRFTPSRDDETLNHEYQSQRSHETGVLPESSTTEDNAPLRKFAPVDNGMMAGLRVSISNFGMPSAPIRLVVGARSVSGEMGACHTDTNGLRKLANALLQAANAIDESNDHRKSRDNTVESFVK